MVETAQRLVWTSAGKPSPRKRTHEANGKCYWCGEDVGREACRTKDVCGPSFSDHDLAAVPTSTWVCVACTWTMTGRPPDTLRLWSVVYREDGHRFAASHPKAPDLGPRVHLQNKADPAEIDEVLRRPPIGIGPWACSIADSGKIHTFPHAVLNRGPGPWCVRFERVNVAATPEQYSAVSNRVRTLYELGYSKDDIATGSPSPSRVARLGIDLWREHDEHLSRYRGGVLIELAIFLARKEQKA